MKGAIPEVKGASKKSRHQIFRPKLTNGVLKYFQICPNSPRLGLSASYGYAHFLIIINKFSVSSVRKFLCVIY